MVSEPRPRPVTTPVAETRATLEGSDRVDQATLPLRSWVVPSLKCPVAMICCRAAKGTVGLPGARVSVCRTAAVTLRVAALLFILPRDAVMFVLPGSVPAVARPCVPGDPL